MAWGLREPDPWVLVAGCCGCATAGTWVGVASAADAAAGTWVGAAGTVGISNVKPCPAGCCVGGMELATCWLIVSGVVTVGAGSLLGNMAQPAMVAVSEAIAMIDFTSDMAFLRLSLLA